jgi:hypothetical protein
MLRRPPALGVFLDYGGDLATFPAVDGLAEAVVVGRRLGTPEEKAARCRSYRKCVEAWLRDGPEALVGSFGADGVASQVVLTAFAWAAECLEDGALAERFEAALPCDVFAEHVGWANERRARMA